MPYISCSQFLKSSILKFVRSYVGEKKVPTLCDDPNLAPYGACRICSVEVALVKEAPSKKMLHSKISCLSVYNL